jgi:hypothetical protein
MTGNSGSRPAGKSRSPPVGRCGIPLRRDRRSRPRAGASYRPALAATTRDRHQLHHRRGTGAARRRRHPDPHRVHDRQGHRERPVHGAHLSARWHPKSSAGPATPEPARPLWHSRTPTPTRSRHADGAIDLSGRLNAGTAYHVEIGGRCNLLRQDPSTVPPALRPGDPRRIRYRRRRSGLCRHPGDLRCPFRLLYPHRCGHRHRRCARSAAIRRGRISDPSRAARRIPFHADHGMRFSRQIPHTISVG